MTSWQQYNSFPRAQLISVFPSTDGMETQFFQLRKREFPILAQVDQY